MKRLLSFVLIAVLAVFSSMAYGSTVNDRLDVRTTIIPACSVSTTTVSFGVHDGSAWVYANGDVTVTCASGTTYNIALDAGLAYDGNYRRVTDGLGTGIWYGLYKGSFIEWGDSDFANTYSWGSSVADTGNGSAQPHNVQGKLWSGFFPSGTYTDVVTVTVYY